MRVLLEIIFLFGILIPLTLLGRALSPIYLILHFVLFQAQKGEAWLARHGTSFRAIDRFANSLNDKDRS